MPQPNVAPTIQPGLTFSQHDLPEPHEFIGEVLASYPVVKIKCSCGYDGLAIVKDGNIVCAGCEARAEAHKRSLGATVLEESPTQAALDELVNARVTAALEPLIAKLTTAQAQLDAQSKQTAQVQLSAQAVQAQLDAQAVQTQLDAQSKQQTPNPQGGKS